MGSFSITNSLSDASRPTLSFEFFPPKDDAGWANLKSSIEHLQGVSPDFVSVTYGAMGSNQATSLAVVEHLAHHVPTIAHLTCIGASQGSISQLLGEYESAGVAGILALRGDLPAGLSEFPQSDYTYALDLVSQVQKSTNFEIGVATFPEKHPESLSIERDIEILKMKQDAGASFGMTQLFFDVDAYTGLVDKARLAGVTMPIVPGVMPIANSKQVLRMAQMSGASVPTALERALVEAPDEAQARTIGMEFTVKLVEELKLRGAPGIHIFTLNHHVAALELVHEAQLA